MAFYGCIVEIQIEMAEGPRCPVDGSNDSQQGHSAAWMRQGKASLILADAAGLLSRRHSGASPRACDPMMQWPAGVSPEQSPRSPPHLSPGTGGTPEPFFRRTPAVSAAPALCTLLGSRAAASEPGGTGAGD